MEIVVSVIIYDVCIYTVDVEMRNNVGGIYIVDVVFISIIITHDALNNIDDVELLNNVGSK